jgi:transposase-like protein
MAQRIELAHTTLADQVVYRSFCRYRFTPLAGMSAGRAARARSTRGARPAKRRGGGSDAMTSRKEYAYHSDTSRNQPSLEAAYAVLLEQGQEGAGEALCILVNEAAKVERSEFLGAAPYERTVTRRDYANGFKPKTMLTLVEQLTLQVPQVRSCDFYPCALEKGTRTDQAVDLALAEMYVQGVSTRRGIEVLQRLLGPEISLSTAQVSRAAAKPDKGLKAWRERPLGDVPYLFLGARYEKVRLEGRIRDCAVLIAVGIEASGKRWVLGCTLATSEAAINWRRFLERLLARGLHGVKLIVAEAARLLQSALESWRKELPKLAEWAEVAAPESLTVFAFPAGHRVRLRTTRPYTHQPGTAAAHPGRRHLPQPQFLPASDFGLARRTRRRVDDRKGPHQPQPITPTS